jgi:pSer/pThr/pTyr-binding forkhead associated (FHA) protein
MNLTGSLPDWRVMNLFAKACGATGPLQLSVERSDDPAIERHVFDAPFLTVGRDPRADLCLTHRGISRRHAYLQLVSGRLYCLDLGSRFGTYVGGECRQAGWVGRRQVIRIGPYRLRLDAGDGEQWASRGGEVNGGASQFPEVSSLPRLFLELWDRSDEPSVWQIERELTLIGTSADCEVRVLDPSVSAQHCSLLRTSTGIWVVDLLGIDGVMVNGTAVRYARVYDGDELHLGNALIRLRYELPRQWAVPSAQLAGNGMMAINPRPVGVSQTALSVRWEGPREGPRRPSQAGFGPPAHVPGRTNESIVPSPGTLSAEWIPADAEQAAQQIEFYNSLLFPVVDRFGLMQQQVLDQFQQSMMMLFQSFSSMHEEQTDILRQEFDQLRDLTQELVALRGELAAQTTSARDESADAPSAGTYSGAPADAPPASVDVEKSPGGTEIYPTSRQGTPPGGGGGIAMPSGPGPERFARPNADRPSAAEDRPAAASRAPEAGAKSGFDPGPAIHAQLRQRIMAIQNEQRSSWQRILNLMPGRSQKKSVP